QTSPAAAAALTGISDMDHVRFPLALLSERRDASRPQSGHSCSATGTVLEAPTPLVAQVPRASLRLPASETLPGWPGFLPMGAVRLDHVGCHASCAMRATICRNSGRVKWPSASCGVKYRACRMRRPPVLKSGCWRLVSDQFWIANGRAS